MGPTLEWTLAPLVHPALVRCHNATAGCASEGHGSTSVGTTRALRIPSPHRNPIERTYSAVSTIRKIALFYDDIAAFARVLISKKQNLVAQWLFDEMI